MPTATSRVRRHNPVEFLDVLRPLQLELASPEDCDDGREIAADLISPHVALALTFRRVQDRTRSTVFVYRQDGQVTGVLGMVPITPQGRTAIQNHLFAQKNPPEEHLCRPEDIFSAMYGWGFAARTRRASAAVVMGAIALRDLYPDIPFFTRAATPAGVKVICGRMGYAPYPGAPDDLLWNPVRTSQERAA